MADCPNPTKARYATQGAAETAAARTASACRALIPAQPRHPYPDLEESRD